MDSICKYKDKLNEALTLAANMNIETKLEAVSYWNSAATHFQKIVDYNDPIQQQEQEQQQQGEQSLTFAQVPILEKDIELKKSSSECKGQIEQDNNSCRQTLPVTSDQHLEESPVGSTTSIVDPLTALVPAPQQQQQYDSGDILDAFLFSSGDYFQVTNVIEDIKQISSQDAIDNDINLTSAPSVIGARDSHVIDYSVPIGESPDTNSVIRPLLASTDLSDVDGKQSSVGALPSGEPLNNILSSHLTSTTTSASANHSLHHHHHQLEHHQQNDLFTTGMGTHQAASQDGLVFVPIFNDGSATSTSSTFPDSADTINRLFEQQHQPVAQQIPVSALSGLECDDSRSSLAHIPKKAAIRHDICNGQFDRGPGHDQSVPSQSYFSEIMSDGVSYDSTTTSFMTNNNANLIVPFRNESYTHGVRPLQQIQVFDSPCGANATELSGLINSRMTHHLSCRQDVGGISIPQQQHDHNHEQHHHQQQQLVINNCLSLLTPPSSSSSANFDNGNISPQQVAGQVVQLDTTYRSSDNSSWFKPTNDQHTCQLCGKTGFSTKGNLKRHLKAHTGEKPYHCDHCDSKFTEKKSLKIHLRRHTGEKPYKCEICHKLFSQTGVLKSHMALHLEERKFNCSKCDKSFRQKSQLNLHLMRHDGIKKLACQICQAKFLTKGDLERHFRIHTGERPYSCKLCGKTFTRQQSLNEHLNRHTGKKPFECKSCDKKFSEMSACYKHAKIHKKEEQYPQQSC